MKVPLRAGMFLFSVFIPLAMAAGDVVGPDAPTPEPDAKSAPAPVRKLPAADAAVPMAPMIAIKAPRTVETPHMVRIEIEESGGPVRELEVTITPEPEADDIMYGSKEIAGPEGQPLRVEDRNKIAFTALPGVYSIEVLAIGLEKGFCRREARIQIRDPRPAAPSTAPTASVPQDPATLLRDWVSAVNSSNRQAEALEIAASARETAREIRAQRSDPNRAIDDWKTAAYLRMGKSFSAWNTNPNGKSFFSFVEDMFADSASLKDFNPANLLDSVAAILEGN